MSFIDEKNDFLVEVSKGRIEGATLFQKFGNGTVGTTPTQVWAGGATAYVYPTTAVTFHISSTDSGDTNAPIDVQGLDTNGDYQTETANLDGADAQTQVVTANAYTRVLRIQHKPTGGGLSGSSKLVGDLYVASASGSSGGIPTVAANIKAKIPSGNEQTQLGFFTIPNGFTGFILNSLITTESSKVLSTDLQIREFGSTFATKGKSSGQDSPIRHERFVYDQIPSRADIQILANVSASSGVVSVLFDVLLIDNDLVSALSFDKDNVT